MVIYAYFHSKYFYRYTSDTLYEYVPGPLRYPTHLHLSTRRVQKAPMSRAVPSVVPWFPQR